MNAEYTIREFGEYDSDLGNLIEHDRRMTRLLIGDHGEPYGEGWLDAITKPKPLRQAHLSYTTWVLCPCEDRKNTIGFAITNLKRSGCIRRVRRCRT